MFGGAWIALLSRHSTFEQILMEQIGQTLGTNSPELMNYMAMFMTKKFREKKYIHVRDHYEMRPCIPLFLHGRKETDDLNSFSKT